MKKYLLITLLLSAVGAITYFTYTKYFVSKTDIWNFVPQESILVYENDNAYQALSTFKEVKIGEVLQDFPSIRTLSNNLNLLDTLVEESALATMLSGSKFLTSFHTTSKSNFDFVVYLKLSQKGQANVINKLIAHYTKQYAASKRKYDGFTLNEIILPDKVFTYIVKDNILAFSFTPFLIEDVIRNLNNKDQDFKTNYPALYKFPNSKTDEGNLYVNGENFKSLINTFLNNNHQLRSNWRSPAFYELSVSDNQLSTNGFVIPKDASLQHLKGQTPQLGSISQTLPECTAKASIFALSDVKNWLERIRTVENKNQKAVKDHLFQQYQFSPDRLVNWMDNELALLDCRTVDVKGQAVLVKVSDLAESRNHLNELAEQVAKSKNDSIFYENFAGYRIVEINEKDVPMAMFGLDFRGFETMCFTYYGSHLLIGDSYEVVKKIVDQFENEETWGKINYYNKFLNQNLQEFNLSTLWNTQKLWKDMYEVMDDEWKVFFDAHASLIQSFDLACYQVSNIDGKYFSNASVYQGGVYNPAPKSNALNKPAFTTYLKNEVTSKPFVVKNHKNNTREVLIQDQANLLYLINKDGAILWTDSLKEKVVDKIWQIDFYKNNKLQYLILSDQFLHLIDRNGNNVEGFPVPHGVDAPSFLGVIDYDKSKSYRFMITSASGEVSLFDKAGKVLDGWSKRSFGGKQLYRPFHERVRGKDCFVFVTENGTVELVNRKGERFNGFPVQLNVGLQGQPHFVRGKSFTTSEVQLIAGNGEFYSVKLDGKSKKLRQFVHTSENSTFSMIEDVSGSKCLVIRQGGNRMELLDTDEKLLLAKDYMSNQEKRVQFYNLDNGDFYIAVNDIDQEFTYIYDKSGKLINKAPLNSKDEIAMMLFSRQDQMKVYTVFKNQLNIYNF